MVPGQRRLRGIRTGIPGNSVVGRLGSGFGPPQIMALQDQRNKLLGKTPVDPIPIDTSGFATTSALASGLALCAKLGTSGTFTVGHKATAYSGGTVSSGTYTPAAANGNLQYYTNNGAHTLAAPSVSGDYTIVVAITNGASAGAIANSGFTLFDGDALDTVAAHRFFVYITRINSIIHGNIKALG